MSKTIYVLNGPNLNLLGVREPDIYGTTTLKDIELSLSAKAQGLGYDLRFLQTNNEGQLIDWVQDARTQGCGLIINPAGYGHTSIALLDALKALTIPIIECHLSNPASRERFRRHSYVSQVANGVIAGFGANSYELSLLALTHILNSNS